MDIHKVIGYLPRPKKGWVLPRHKYTGPYNPLHEQLDENDLHIIGQEPFNKVDEISMRHDICYRDHPDAKAKCDDVMLDEIDILEPHDRREKLDKFIVKKVIGTKRKLGLGITWSNTLANELHKPLRHNFQKRYVFVRHMDDIWGADLVDMRALADENDGYNYILMVMDVFSKYGWAVPLKYKTGEATKEGLATILNNKDGMTPKKIWADKGTEFYNKEVKQYLESKDITLYSTENEEKCSVIERWNRTIKTWLWKYFTANGTHKYIDILQPLIDKYNSTKHRAIGFTPSDARKPSNHEQVYKNLYSKKVETLMEIRSEPKYKVGDKVRLAVLKDKFEKAYIINWSDRVYTIKEVKNTLPYTYIVQDDRGKVHKGSFYEQDLQETKVDIFRIEKIIDWKTEKGKRYGLVKWMDHDDSYNSWEREEKLNDIYRTM